MPRPTEPLPWEDYVVVTLIQSLWGLVSPQLRGVAVNVTPEDVTVFFAISVGDDEELNDNINEVIGELWGLLMPDPRAVHGRIHVGRAGPGWEGWEHRLVLLAKNSMDEAWKPAST